MQADNFINERVFRILELKNANPSLGYLLFDIYGNDGINEIKIINERLKQYDYGNEPDLSKWSLGMNIEEVVKYLVKYIDVYGEVISYNITCYGCDAVFLSNVSLTKDFTYPSGMVNNVYVTKVNNCVLCDGCDEMVGGYEPISGNITLFNVYDYPVSREAIKFKGEVDNDV